MMLALAALLLAGCGASHHPQRVAACPDVLHDLAAFQRSFAGYARAPSVDSDVTHRLGVVLHDLGTIGQQQAARGIAIGPTLKAEVAIDAVELPLGTGLPPSAPAADGHGTVRDKVRRVAATIHGACG